MTPIPDHTVTAHPLLLVWVINKGAFWRRRGHGYTQLVSEAQRWTADEVVALQARRDADAGPGAPATFVTVPAPDGNRYQSHDTRPLLALAGEALAACLLTPELDWSTLLQEAAEVQSPADRVAWLSAVAHRLLAAADGKAAHVDPFGIGSRGPHLGEFTLTAEDGGVVMACPLAEAEELPEPRALSVGTLDEALSRAGAHIGRWHR